MKAWPKEERDSHEWVLMFAMGGSRWGARGKPLLWMHWFGEGCYEMGYAVIQIIIFEGIGFLLSESWIGVVTVLKNIGAFFFFLRWWTDDLCLLTYEHVLNTHRQNQRSESNHSTSYITSWTQITRWKPLLSVVGTYCRYIALCRKTTTAAKVAKQLSKNSWKNFKWSWSGCKG